MNLLVPLGGWVVIRHIRGKLDGRGMALRMAGIAACQFLISPELLATGLVVGALAWVVAYALLPDRRSALRRAARSSAVGLAGAGVVLSPLLVTMLRDAPGGVLHATAGYSVDLLGLIVPTRVTALDGTWAAGIANHFAGNTCPLLALMPRNAGVGP
jgi:hypothetical protein